jgi:hypothetical protein
VNFPVPADQLEPTAFEVIWAGVDQPVGMIAVGE